MKANKSYCTECGRPKIVYKRSLTGGAKHFLINLDLLTKNCPDVKFWHYKKVITRSSGELDYSICEQFGLIQRNPMQSGYWAITPIGKDFVNGLTSIAKSIYLYLGTVIKEDTQKVFIKEIGKEKFEVSNLYEL